MATVIPAGPSILSEALGVARFLQSQEAMRFNKQHALDRFHLAQQAEERLSELSDSTMRLREFQIDDRNRVWASEKLQREIKNAFHEEFMRLDGPKKKAAAILAEYGEKEQNSNFLIRQHTDKQVGINMELEKLIKIKSHAGKVFHVESWLNRIENNPDFYPAGTHEQVQRLLKNTKENNESKKTKDERTALTYTLSVVNNGLRYNGTKESELAKIGRTQEGQRILNDLSKEDLEILRRSTGSAGLSSKSRSMLESLRESLIIKLSKNLGIEYPDLARDLGVAEESVPPQPAPLSTKGEKGFWNRGVKTKSRREKGRRLGSDTPPPGLASIEDILAHTSKSTSRGARSTVPGKEQQRFVLFREFIESLQSTYEQSGSSSNFHFRFASDPDPTKHNLGAYGSYPGELQRSVKGTGNYPHEININPDLPASLPTGGSSIGKKGSIRVQKDYNQKTSSWLFLSLIQEIMGATPEDLVNDDSTLNLEIAKLLHEGRLSTSQVNELIKFQHNTKYLHMRIGKGLSDRRVTYEKRQVTSRGSRGQLQ